MMGDWTARAEALTADLDELGAAIAEVNAAAWRARVDPAATEGLVAAALALNAPPQSLLPRGRPLRQDRDLVAAAQDFEAGAAERLTQARALHKQAAASLSEAEDALRAAQLARAAADERGEDAAAHAAAAVEAERLIGDCEAALDLLTVLLPRLEYALRHLGRVPADLAETYERVYEHLRRMGKIPHSGDWWSGAVPVGGGY